MEDWSKLDHAGKVFPAVAGKENSSTYRLSMILTSPIDPELLQKALDKVISRFPNLNVELQNGLFWKFLRQKESRLIVEQETNYPCAPVDLSEQYGSLVRVLYYKNKISIEVFHAITDGGGALEFLKTLVFQYLYTSGVQIDDREGVILPPDSFARYAEAQDSFRAYYTNSQSHLKDEVSNALKIPGTRFMPYGHNVVHGFIHANQLNAAAKIQGVTVTAYLTAILIMAVHAATMTINSESQQSIVISLPVNLRKLFPSISLRNFFTVINIEIYMKQELTFEQVLEAVSEQMKKKTKKPYLYETIANSMKYEKNWLSRFVPLKLKNLAMRYGFDRYSEAVKTMTLTNLGRISIPSSMTQYVEAMETTMYPTSKTPINCAVCSVNETLTITFARNILESDVIMHFFRLLSGLSGLELKIVSNDWGMET
ncbi:alcohol acetyltransferase [Paenibacillus sp. FSL M8-0334]|uniref:alcohol acetyltransferase n=1 Tax=Paenibacillus sp. FSL M8-0334 TaxID=2921623 RepID=UPI0030FAEB81